ncbi:MAG: hypothetical protein PHS59_00480 [Paludibacter sp.]|nr:hypothetical protein [Paludibacter sp.]
MKTNAIFRGKWFKFLMIAISLIYLFFPNNNHLADSLDYGASVKFGLDLFYAHHLLFNYFNRLLFIAVNPIFPSLDALKFIQFINASVTILSLFLLQKIIYKQTGDNTKANIWTFFVACSFGVMRFAVEAETYVIPIFFSLISTLFYQRYLTNSKYITIFLSGLFASIACLFHQIHLFWGIGLFIGLIYNKNIKSLGWYLLSTPLVLIIYSVVLVTYYKTGLSFENLFKFLAEYYFNSKAETSIGLSNFVITAITFFRTFFQVHGLVPEVLRLLPFSYIIIPIVVTLIGYSVILFFKSLKINSKNKISEFERTHLIIFTLQFAFAFYSMGNSEFMVMLAFLIPLFIHVFIELDMSVVKNLAFAMLIWNFTFAILPNHIFDYQNNKVLTEFIHNHPDKVFILKERNLLANQYFYEYGIQKCPDIIESDKTDLIKKFKINGYVFYTDILSKKVPYNRVDFTSKTSETNLKFVKHIKHFNSDMGGFYIDEVEYTHL